MQRILLIAFLLITSVAALAAERTPEEVAVLKAFEDFAKAEAERQRTASVDIGKSIFAEAIGWPVPMSLPRKYRFFGYQIEAPPEAYAIDVRRTDSLVSPYVGTIELPIVVITAQTHATGPRESCRSKTLRECLDNGGSLYESAVLYRDAKNRSTGTVKSEYLFQDGQWTPKRKFEADVRAFVAATAKPLPPIPQMFGIPFTPVMPGLVPDSQEPSNEEPPSKPKSLND